MSGTHGSCDSCGRDDVDVRPVHRKYVRPTSWDQEGSEQVLDELEHWCVACLTNYPHQPVGW